MEDPNHPSCLRCSAYFVTYEPRHPHGCRTYGIRSKTLPSLAVLQSSGEPCQAFERRAAPRGGQPRGTQRGEP